MDGHSSNYQPATIQRLAEEGVIVFLLPPRTSHLTQPLCFGPLKMHWRKECYTSGCDKAPVLSNFSEGVVKVNDDDQCSALIFGRVRKRKPLTLCAPYRITEIVACTRSLSHALCLPAHARAPATRSSIKRVGLPELRQGLLGKRYS